MGERSADRVSTSTRGTGVWRWLAALLLAILAVRLATLGVYVLYDTTEARYAEVARLMLASGDWVTPQNDPGVPFWAKPPLYAWAGALSMAVFGVNEFAARMPSWWFALGTLAVVHAWAAARSRDASGMVGLPAATAEAEARVAGLAAALVLGTTFLFFVSAGAVMTEASLVLATAGMSAGFWFAVVRPFARAAAGGQPPAAAAPPAAGGWPWAFFVAAGVGMLAKGPVAIVYAGLPVLAWVAWHGAAGWRAAWRGLPWVRGSLLALAVCGPWYLLAEWRTPGYWEYFFIGEHVMRFLDPGWDGDRYGNAHVEPRGTIWAFAGLAGLPWTVVLVVAAAAAGWSRRRGGAGALAESGTPASLAADRITRRYLWAVALAPLVFFTLSRNIIWTYALPSLPAVALLLAPVLRRALASRWRWPLGVAAVTVVAWAALFVLWIPEYAHGRSTMRLVAQWQSAQATAPGPLVFVGAGLPHSAKFYSRAQARLAPTAAAALEVPGAVVYVATDRPDDGRPEPPRPDELMGAEDLGAHEDWRLWRVRR